MSSKLQDALPVAETITRIGYVLLPLESCGPCNNIQRLYSSLYMYMQCKSQN